ncbi:MAG: phospho-N-acetylmuramoyl-pentapeptide-transferase [Planctomycetota bacterium]
MLYLLLDSLRAWLAERGLYGFPISLLDQVEFRAMAAAFVAFVAVVVLGKPVIRWLVRQKIGDVGATDAAALRDHAASKSNTPTMGGILICGAILACTLFLADLRARHVQLAVVVVGWLGVLGGFDDWLKLTAQRRGTGRQGLLAWEKLVFQLGLGLIIGVFAYRAGDLGEGPDVAHVLNMIGQRTYDPVTGEVEPGLIYFGFPVFVIITMLMVTGMSNAVNITDGMDGLASGVSASVAFGLMILALIAGNEGLSQYFLVPSVVYADELAVPAGAMAGACLGFLWWNCSPAHVFMGDTGSLALGGLIAYIAVVTRQEIVVLVMSGVFLIEIASVVLQVAYFKATGGRRILRCAPIHHHYHLGGWTESQVVQRAWILSVLLGIVALATLKVR